MKKYIHKMLIAGMVLPLMMLVGCSPNSDRPHYSKIYEGTNGCYYARDYDDGNFWYWMYVLNTSSSSSSQSSAGSSYSRNSPSYFSSGNGSWVRATTIPTGLKSTSEVLEEEKDVPVEVEQETPVLEKETITEETTEQQAQVDETTETGTSESSGESSSASGESGSSGSGSSSGDSGSSSGGDGGGDGGGGGE